MTRHVTQGLSKKWAHSLMLSALPLLLGACQRAPQLAVSSSSVSAAGDEEVKEANRPRLVVWLTVDQLKGEFWERHGSRLTRGGFARFFDEGFVYTQAHYSHAITETAPGHATLFSGAAPSEHGIIGNSWLLANGQTTSSVLDASTTLIGPGVSAGKGSVGASPHLLLVPTVGDEMRRVSDGRAKVFAVSAKDRAAILPAGQSGQAYWLGEEGFVTSSAYGQVPAWLLDHQREHAPKSYLERPWSLLDEPEAYVSEAAVSPHAEKRLGAGFPHRFTDELPPAKALSLSPFGDAAVIDLARRIVSEENLGRDAQVDLLSISLSSTDMIGHAFGPESREMEDQLRRLDAALAEFFSELDASLGPTEVLYVLSADHGGCESAAFLQRLGLPGARLTEGALEEKARGALLDEYGHSRFLLGVSSPGVSLNHAVIEEQGVELGSVRSLVAQAVATVPGVYRVFEKGGDFAEDAVSQRVAASMHHERSGDLYVVPQPYTLFLQNESLAATHGSPWNYDTHVPLAFSGAGISAGRSSRWVDVRSLAPTVAALAGVPAPPAASLPRLTELFD